jgi:hypothetical protein
VQQAKKQYAFIFRFISLSGSSVTGFSTWGMIIIIMMISQMNQF